MDDLPEDLYSEISDESEQGNDLMEQGRYTEALEIFESALNKLPCPIEKWEAFVWLKAAIGDAQFLMCNYKQATEEFFDAMNGPDGYSNPFVLLRLGECLYEQNSVKAIDYLCKAYFLEGEEIFKDEDNKYLQAVKSFLNLA